MIKINKNKIVLLLYIIKIKIIYNIDKIMYINHHINRIILINIKIVKVIYLRLHVVHVLILIILHKINIKHQNHHPQYSIQSIQTVIQFQIVIPTPTQTQIQINKNF